MIALMPTMSSGSDSVGAVVSKKPVIQVSNAGGAGVMAVRKGAKGGGKGCGGIEQTGRLGDAG